MQSAALTDKAVPEWLQQGFLFGQIRAANRWLLGVNLALAAALVLTAFCYLREISNLVGGASPIGRSALLALKPATLPWRTYVRVNVETNFGPWLREVSVSKNLVRWEAPVAAPSAGSTSGAIPQRTFPALEGREFEWARYTILAVGDRYLIVRQQHDAGEPNGPEPIEASVAGMLVPVSPELAARFPTTDRFPEKVLPVMLDVPVDRPEQWTFFLLGCVGLVVAAWNVWRSERRFARWELHPLVRELAHHGDFVLLATAIEHERADPNGRFTLSSIEFTRSWVLMPTTFSANVIQFNELIWVHSKVTQHYTYLIPTGQTCSVLLYSRQGKKLEITTTKAHAEQLVLEVVRRVPWVFAGYHDEMLQGWRSERAEMIRQVDERRRSWGL